MKTPLLTTFGRLILAFFFCAAPLAASTGAQAAQIKKIEHRASSGSEEVVLSFDSAVEPKLFTIKGPQPRVVLDFVDVSPAGSAKAAAGKGGVVKNLRMAVHRENGLKTRLVLDMASLNQVNPQYRIEGNKVILTLKGAGKAKKQAPETMPVAMKKPVAPQTPVAQAQEAPKLDEQQPEPAVAEKPLSARERAKLAREQRAAAKKAKQEAEAAKKEKKEAEDEAAKAALAEKETPAPVATEATDPADNGATSAEPETPYLAAIQFDPDSPRGELVQFKLNGFYPPVLRSTDEGNPQVICEFNNLGVAPALRAPLKVNGRLVKDIRVDAGSEDGKTQVVVELAPGKHYDLQQVFFKEDNFFVLMVNTAKSSE